jgi:ribonuclease HII
MQDAGRFDSTLTNESSDRVALFPDLHLTGICLDLETQAFEAGYRYIAGIDEVGRGCLAGPVVAAACILDITKPLIDGINDSKKLTPKIRESLAEQLKTECIAFATGQVEAVEIDQINILEATKKAMKAALQKLQPQADFLLIDAVALKDMQVPQRSIIRGDSLSGSIAAASILAKTFRDALMRDYHTKYPHYGFHNHVGYATSEHMSALREHGATPIHRRSFRGVLPE